jgi:hypothetical protein
MENMDKGLTVPKWVLIIWSKIPQMPKNLSVQFVCPSKKVLDFNKKRLHWAFVIRDWKQASTLKKNEVHPHHVTSGQKKTINKKRTFLPGCYCAL